MVGQALLLDVGSSRLEIFDREDSTSSTLGVS